MSARRAPLSKALPDNIVRNTRASTAGGASGVKNAVLGGPITTQPQPQQHEVAPSASLPDVPMSAEEQLKLKLERYREQKAMAKASSSLGHGKSTQLPKQPLQSKVSSSSSSSSSSSTVSSRTPFHLAPTNPTQTFNKNTGPGYASKTPLPSNARPVLDSMSFRGKGQITALKTPAVRTNLRSAVSQSAFEPVTSNLGKPSTGSLKRSFEFDREDNRQNTSFSIYDSNKSMLQEAPSTLKRESYGRQSLATLLRAERELQQSHQSFSYTHDGGLQFSHATEEEMQNPEQEEVQQFTAEENAMQEGQTLNVKQHEGKMESAMASPNLSTVSPEPEPSKADSNPKRSRQSNSFEKTENGSEPGEQSILELQKEIKEYTEREQQHSAKELELTNKVSELQSHIHELEEKYQFEKAESEMEMESLKDSIAFHENSAKKATEKYELAKQQAQTAKQSYEELFEETSRTIFTQASTIKQHERSMNAMMTKISELKQLLALGERSERALQIISEKVNAPFAEPEVAAEWICSHITELEKKVDEFCQVQKEKEEQSNELSVVSQNAETARSDAWYYSLINDLHTKERNEIDEINKRNAKLEKKKEKERRRQLRDQVRQKIMKIEVAGERDSAKTKSMKVMEDEDEKQVEEAPGAPHASNLLQMTKRNHPLVKKMAEECLSLRFGNEVLVQQKINLQSKVEQVSRENMEMKEMYEKKNEEMQLQVAEKVKELQENLLGGLEKSLHELDTLQEKHERLKEELAAERERSSELERLIVQS